MSVQNLLYPNDADLYADSYYCNSLDSVDFEGTLAIGAAKADRIDIGNSGNQVYINDSLINPSLVAGYTVNAPIEASNANGIIVNNSTGEITLEYANVLYPGILSRTNQIIIGEKTFGDNLHMNPPAILDTDYVDSMSAGTLRLGTASAFAVNVGRAGANTVIASDRVSVTQAVVDAPSGVALKLNTTFTGGVELGDTYSHTNSASARVATIDTNGHVGTLSTPILPAGTIMDYAGNAPPTGFLLCNGNSYATATYPALFTAIGYVFGGSGANFNVPDARGRTSIGVGAGSGLTNRTLASTGGQESVTLDISQMPSHNHNMQTDQTSAGGTSSANSYLADGYPVYSGYLNSPSNLATDAITYSGGNGSHENMMPFIAFNKIIKT